MANEITEQKYSDTLTRLFGDTNKNISLTIYVPSTMHNLALDSKVREHFLFVVNRTMIDMFGGTTQTESFGSYLGENGNVIYEPITKITSLTDKDTLYKSLNAIKTMVEGMKFWLQQESIMLELNNKAYFA